jgi:hypothetical protein
LSQTILLKIVNGEFTTTEPAISVGKDERIRVSAEAWSPAFTGPAKDEVLIGIAEPISSRLAYTILFGLALLFAGLALFSFTGPDDKRGKNRLAITLSYIGVIIFVAIPLVAPIVLTQFFPEFLDQMKVPPVGLIVAKAQDRDPPEAQWVLNIGGCTSLNAEESGDSKATKSGAARLLSTSNPSSSPMATASLGAEQALSATRPQNSILDPSDLTPSGATDREATKPLVVSGGLVVPLYVIILSVIGGAINITRKMPVLQWQAETPRHARIPQFLMSPLERFGRAVMKSPSKWFVRQLPESSNRPNQTKRHPGSAGDAGQQTSSQESAEAPVHQESEPGKQQTNITPETARRGEEAEKDRDGTKMDGEHQEIQHWRKELLTQHMYLISAPFLGRVCKSSM